MQLSLRWRYATKPRHDKSTHHDARWLIYRTTYWCIERWRTFLDRTRRTRRASISSRQPWELPLYCNRRLDWKIPLVRQHKNLFITCNTRVVLFTRAELKRMQRHFWNPSAKKLLNITPCTGPADTPTETLRTLKEINRSCLTCQRYFKGPIRFQFAFPNEECIFNHELASDLVRLDGKSFLHVFDKHTNFSAAIFI